MSIDTSPENTLVIFTSDTSDLCKLPIIFQQDTHPTDMEHTKE